MIEWISHTSYSYTVLWTNLCTGLRSSSTLLENTNKYTVTGLSDNANYNVSVAAMNLCAYKTSDPRTVYGM